MSLARATAARRLTARVSLFSAAIAGTAISIPLFTGQRYFGLDLMWNDLGFVCEFRRLLSSHEGLSISSLLGNGEPFLGNPLAQVLYPPRWLSLLFPGQGALSFQIVFHIALAARII